MRVKRAHESQSQQRHASPWPSHHEATWQLQGDPNKVSSGRFDMTRGVEGAMVEDCQGSGHGINGRVRGVEQGLRDGKRGLEQGASELYPSLQVAGGLVDVLRYNI